MLAHFFQFFIWLCIHAEILILSRSLKLTAINVVILLLYHLFCIRVVRCQVVIMAAGEHTRYNHVSSRSRNNEKDIFSYFKFVIFLDLTMVANELCSQPFYFHISQAVLQLIIWVLFRGRKSGAIYTTVVRLECKNAKWERQAKRSTVCLLILCNFHINHSYLTSDLFLDLFFRMQFTFSKKCRKWVWVWIKYSVCIAGCRYWIIMEHVYA